MTVYAADRHLPGISMDQLADAQKAAIETSKRFTEEGRPVQYIRSTYLPDDDRCVCLFEAQDAEDVKAVNDEAGIPYQRVVQAHDLTPS
jgi:predicted DNA binding CopG/RHH family protein